MNYLRNVTLSAAAVIALPLLSFAGDKEIYGRDDRLDYFEAREVMQTLSGSIVSLWKSYKVKVRDAGSAGYFVTDLDNFGGNSGSAVFNLSTNKIEGLMIGGGEDVTRISAVSAYIPRLPDEEGTGPQPDPDLSGL